MQHAPAGSNSSAAPTSLYGHDLLTFIEGYEEYRSSAYATAVYALTHGDNYPLEHAVQSLGTYDRAAFDVLEGQRGLGVLPPAAPTPTAALLMYINTLGRLHIRRPDMPRPEYSASDKWMEIGSVEVDAQLLREIDIKVEAAESSERAALKEIERAMLRLRAQGGLGAAIERGMDSIQHIDNICFYVNDRFYALIERYANLIDTKGSTGLLSRLPTKDYDDWTAEERLVVAALHALLLSGGAGRLEEFNGLVLTARGLLAKLHGFLELYRSVGCRIEVSDTMDLFEKAAVIGDQARASVGQPWLRYRWIYGLNFQKVERIITAQAPKEDPKAYLDEFGQDYREISSLRGSHELPENLFFTELACAYLGRDLAGVPCHRGSSAVTGWFEYLMEKIVVSAVRVARADYGMSSSLRDISSLVEYEEATRVAKVHALTQYDFFTCFVSRDFKPRLGAELAETIALSVQKRMMFNRWHFIPGNLERSRVAHKRHWFYPPAVPDIAAHSNMHRAAHNKAQVKFSIRSPGPDLGRPGLQIAGQTYRGFFDVRVVRMDGDRGFTPDDLLRVRRRALWLESLYTVLVTYLQGPAATRFAINGFHPGSYLDLTESEVPVNDHVVEERISVLSQP
jgi:hypothetical protein